MFPDPQSWVARTIWFHCSRHCEIFFQLWSVRNVQVVRGRWPCDWNISWNNRFPKRAGGGVEDKRQGWVSERLFKHKTTTRKRERAFLLLLNRWHYDFGGRCPHSHILFFLLHFGNNEIIKDGKVGEGRVDKYKWRVLEQTKRSPGSDSVKAGL